MDPTVAASSSPRSRDWSDLFSRKESDLGVIGGLADVMPEFGGLNPAKALTESIYLDYASATPVSLPALKETFAWSAHAAANPANRLHRAGEYAEHGLWDARQRVARCLGCKPNEVCFLSSATEANNLVLRGLVSHPKRKKERNRLVVSPSEHASVMETALALQRLPLAHPVEVVFLKLDSQGQVDLDDARKKIQGNTLCVSVMDLNNETGVAQKQLTALIEMTHEVGAYFHCDSAQGFGRNNFRCSHHDVDFAVVSSGKIYGPRGAAALVIRENRRIRLAPQLTGGGHEAGLRSSTPNLPAIRGFATAAEIMVEMAGSAAAHCAQMEKLFLTELRRHQDVHVHGEEQRVPGILMLSFPNTNAMKLLEHAAPLCLSAGSACKTLQATASHVLLSMGVPLEEALGSFRVSFGLPTSSEEVLRSVEVLSRAAKRASA